MMLESSPESEGDYEIMVEKGDETTSIGYVVKQRKKENAYSRYRRQLTIVRLESQSLTRSRFSKQQ